MSEVTQKCHKCGKELKYNEKIDEENVDIIPKKIRKVVVDDKGQSFPFFSIPKDKQKIIRTDAIKFECSKCFTPIELAKK